MEKKRQSPLPNRRRVQVSMTQEQWAMLERISDLTGSPKATLLMEIFEVALPAFDTTIKALELAKEQPREAQRLVTNYGAKTVMDLQQQQLALDEAITKHGGAKSGRSPK